jgi:SAM-dependent methyltransferase
MGRHTHHFLANGAEVVALDASSAIDAASSNNPSERALFVQADLLRIPLQSEVCDLACCFGVLHHIEDPASGLREIVRVVRPGGSILVYLYHDPSEIGAVRGWLLSLATAARKLTTRTPLPVLQVLTWAFAALLYLAYVGPAKVACRIGALGTWIRGLPLGQYVDYPFRVLWNDQFDRFSAPLERRFRRAEVEDLLKGAGLVDLRILGGYGWRAAGRKPVEPARPAVSG